LFYGLLNEGTYTKKALETKFMVFAGRSSYVFYLIHMGLFHGLVVDYVGNFIWISFILLNILAALLFKFIEEPLNGGIRKLYALRIEKNKTQRL
jgi:peptidoglycan/LPS O-acetylase OafA/YrhL